MSTKTITINRDNGARVQIEVMDATHYEVSLFYDSDDYDEVYERYELVVAPNAAAARKIGRRLCVEGEVVDTVAKLSHAEVAVQTLHGAQVVR